MPKSLKEEKNLQCFHFYRQGLQFLQDNHTCDAAYRNFQHILWMNSDDPLAYYLASYCLFEMGHFQKSRRYHQKALQINGICKQFHELAPSQQFLGQLKVKISDMSKDTSGYLMQKKMYLNSAYSFQYALTGQIFSYTHLSTLGYKYYEAGKYEEAIQRYKVILVHNQEFRFYNNLGLLSYCCRNFEEGKYFIQKALELKPNWPRSLYILSFYHMKEGKYEEALDAIKLTISQEQDTMFYHLKYMIILMVSLTPANAEEIKNTLDYPLQMLKNKQKDGSSDLLKPMFYKFIGNTIFFLYHYLESVMQTFQTLLPFIKLLDDFLLVGSSQKYRLASKIDAIRLIILQTHQNLNLTQVEQSIVDNYE